MTNANEFVAIDVETANADVSSICQIGVARYVGGELVDQWSSLIDPEDEFDPINVFVHGIDRERVFGSPTFRYICQDLAQLCNGKIIVSHTMYDRTALMRASARYGVQPLEANWIDSARVARRAWEQFAHRGYGPHQRLSNARILLPRATMHSLVRTHQKHKAPEGRGTDPPGSRNPYSRGV